MADQGVLIDDPRGGGESTTKNKWEKFGGAISMVLPEYKTMLEIAYTKPPRPASA